MGSQTSEKDFSMEWLMPVTGDENVRWLSAIGRSLAYLCLEKAQAAGSLPSVLAKVDFLKGLGLSEADASYAAGS